MPDDSEVAEDDAPRGVSVGIVMGGTTSDNEPVQDAWQRLAQALDSASAYHPADVGINVIFHVSGQFWKPRFTGIRTGTVATSRKSMMVQVAVPDEAWTRADPYLAETVRQAVAVAEAYVKRRSLGWDFGPLWAALDEVSTQP